MKRTRNQGLNLKVKEEDREDKFKLDPILNSKNNTIKKKRKTLKSKEVETWIDISPRYTQVKPEDKNNHKLDLSSSKPVMRKLKITKEQLEKLIGYIVNDKIKIKEAARKVGIAYVTALRYHQIYKKDPEHKIPLPKTYFHDSSSRVTQAKMENLINYVVRDKMLISHAIEKAKINRKTAMKYYKQYLDDPDKKIPSPCVKYGLKSKIYTQDQIERLIDYIVNDNMSVADAATKAEMGIITAQRYYLRYLNDPNREIPGPQEPSLRCIKKSTNDEVKTLIDCIVEKGMTLREASVSANMGVRVASKYYRQYLEDPNHEIPMPESKPKARTNLTTEQIEKFFTYVIIDKLNTSQASKKANISLTNGSRYYKTYLKSPPKEFSTKYHYSVEKMTKMIDYIQKDKMNIKEAAKKAELYYKTARKLYQKYMNDPQHKVPTPQRKKYTQEDIKNLIKYVEQDKLTIPSAAKRAKMVEGIARGYYKEYQDDPEHKIPTPRHNGEKLNHQTKHKYAQMIADIYKKKALIEEACKKHISDSKSEDTDIKLESLDEDTQVTMEE